MKAKIADLEGRLEEKSQLVLRLEEDLVAADAAEGAGTSPLKRKPSETSLFMGEGMRLKCSFQRLRIPASASPNNRFSEAKMYEAAQGKV